MSLESSVIQPNKTDSSKTHPKSLTPFPETISQKTACLWVAQELERHIDQSYKDFQSKLIPTIDPSVILGVRMPQLRRIAKSLYKNKPLAHAYLQALPHATYEENNIHGLLINEMQDCQQSIQALTVFLPEVDNWATCDLLSPKPFKKTPEGLLPVVDGWLASSHTYTIRFGVSVLMQNYLTDAFDTRILERVITIQSEEYYVNMMRAWFFAEALAKQEKATLPLLEQRRLDTWTHNKSIQKAIESRRIAPELKDYLRSLKVKTR